MRLLLLLFIFTSALLSVGNAYAYGLSFVLEQRKFFGFTENIYSYSSMFRQGRDLFHWVDASYAKNDYILEFERGEADSVGGFYRFANRQRWGRYFKPLFLLGVGAYYRTRAKREEISVDNFLLGSLPNKEGIDFNLQVGAGYLWEIKRASIAVSFNYGYDFGYKSAFYSPAFIFVYGL